MRKVKVGATPISVIKEKYLAQEIFDLNELYRLADNTELNPSGICWEDEQKVYFYNDKVAYFYFKSGSDGHG